MKLVLMDSAMNYRLFLSMITVCMLSCVLCSGDAAAAAATKKTAKTKKVQPKKISRTAASVGTMINGEEWRLLRDSVSFIDGEWDNTGVLAANKKITVASLTFNFAKNHAVEFYPDGNIRRGFITASVTVQTIKITGDIHFYNNGSIQSATLAENGSVQKITFRKGRRIFLYDTGGKNISVERGILATNATINGVAIGRDSELTFEDNSGKLTSARMLSDERVGDYRFRRTTTVRFHQTNGALKSGIISISSLINGKLYPPDTFIEFDDTGKLIRAVSQ